MATDATARQPERSTPPRVGEHRLAWSKWLRCESSFSLLLVPAAPGVYAVAEEIAEPGDPSAITGKRLLALLQFAEADDLSRSLGRLFTPASPLYERIVSGNCFVRYAEVEDATVRESACLALRDWLANSPETVAAQSPRSHHENGKTMPQVAPPAPLPAGF